MVDFSRDKEWKNWSEGIVRKPERTYYPRTMEDLKTIVVDANRAGKRVHAVGAGWSFTDAMATDDYFVATEQMNGLIGLWRNFREWESVTFLEDGRISWVNGERNPVFGALLGEVSHSGRRLVHVKAGTTINQLYRALYELDPQGQDYTPWALPTMGGGSGQTIAGAISTGTHGGDFSQPPIADMVQAIHLVDPSGNARWIERGGNRKICYPATLVAKGVAAAEHIHQDDKWFRAALVALGNFGIVYSYVIEVQDQFGISEVNRSTTWADIRPSLASGEIFESTRYSEQSPDRRWIDEHPNVSGRSPLGIGLFINPYRISDDYDTDPAPDRAVTFLSHAKAPEWDGHHVPTGGGFGGNLERFHLIDDFEDAGNVGQLRTLIDRVMDGLRNSQGTDGKYRVAHTVLDTTGGGREPIVSFEIAISTRDGKHVEFIDQCLDVFDYFIREYWQQGHKMALSEKTHSAEDAVT